MNRRELIALLGGIASTRSLPAQAQKTPIIGYLHTTSLKLVAPLLETFTKTLATAGYRDGRNVRIEYRWAQGHYDRLESLAAELVRLNPTVIVATGGSVAGKAAKAVTSKIPILFIAGFDPVQEGLVHRINRPGGNATGVAVYTVELGTKRMAMLQQIAPGRVILMLVNPDASSTAREVTDAQAAAGQIGSKLTILEAKNDQQIEASIEAAAASGPGALLVSADSFFTSRHKQIVTLAARHSLPACYPWPQYVVAGGLMSYGTDLNWAFEKIAVYAAQILNGANPSELPVQLPSKFSTAINLQTARRLQLAIPPWLLVAADRVIE